jgi:hypothetical protein
METLDNNSFNDNNGLSAETKKEFVEAGNWMKIYSITMIVLLSIGGLFLLLGIAAAGGRGLNLGGGAGLAIVPLLLFVAMIVFLVRAISSVYKTSGSFTNVGLTDDAENLVKGFKSYREYWTNLLIILGILLLIVVYIFAVLGVKRFPGLF